MTTLLNSFAFAQRDAFVSGFEYGAMHEYIAHLVNRSADARVQVNLPPLSSLQEVIFIDTDKVVDKHGKPCTSENVKQVLRNFQLDNASINFFNSVGTVIISYYTDNEGNQLTVMPATNFIKNEGKRARSVSTTLAGYFHYLLNVYAAYLSLPLDELAFNRLQIVYRALSEQTGEKLPTVFEEIIADLPKAKVYQLLRHVSIVPPVTELLDNSDGFDQSDAAPGVQLGGGYGFVPADNPHVSKELGDGDAFLTDFTSSNASAILMVADVGYNVKLTLKCQPSWINSDQLTVAYNKEPGKHYIIYIKYGSTLDTVKFINSDKVRFTPGHSGDKCHFGTFHVDDKRYVVLTVTPENTGFMEDLYNMADTNAELVYVGLHLMYLLQENVVMGKSHEVKQLYLAFNAIEKLTGKPFHEQEWLLKHLGHKRFDALKLRHQYNFPI